MAKGIDGKLDRLWSELVRERDGCCMYCGRTESLDAHHIIGRANRSTRWDLENGITLCKKHHVFSNEFSAHGTPVKFTHWLEEQKGREWVEALVRKGNETVKFSKHDKEELYEQLQRNKGE